MLKIDVLEIEELWKERYNVLIDSMIDYCKKTQANEVAAYKDEYLLHPWRIPTVPMLDNIILELQKHKI